MKIRIWAFVLIIAGTLLLGLAGGFIGALGLTLAGRVADRVLSNDLAPRVEVQLPGDNRGGWQDGMPWQGGQSGDGSDMPRQGGRWGDGQPWQGGGDGGLPQGFNAGVSIPGTYGELTGRTEEAVLAAAEEAKTDTWGLAKQEGKLEELKTKVREAVVASLDKMVADGKITKEQKDVYLQKVDLILKSAGQADENPGMTVQPFGGLEEWDGRPKA